MYNKCNIDVILKMFWKHPVEILPLAVEILKTRMNPVLERFVCLRVFWKRIMHDYNTSLSCYVPLETQDLVREATYGSSSYGRRCLCARDFRATCPIKKTAEKTETRRGVAGEERETPVK